MFKENRSIKITDDVLNLKAATSATVIFRDCSDSDDCLVELSSDKPFDNLKIASEDGALTVSSASEYSLGTIVDAFADAVKGNFDSLKGIATDPTSVRLEVSVPKSVKKINLKLNKGTVEFSSKHAKKFDFKINSGTCQLNLTPDFKSCEARINSGVCNVQKNGFSGLIKAKLRNSVVYEKGDEDSGSVEIKINNGVFNI